MTESQFAEWKADAEKQVASVVQAILEAEKVEDLADRTMLGRAIADKLWTLFGRIVDEQFPVAVDAVLTKIAAMSPDDLVSMLIQIKGN